MLKRKIGPTVPFQLNSVIDNQLVSTIFMETRFA